MVQKRTAPAPALVLFDIDGTLLCRAGPHHREALVDAVRRASGLETTTENVPVHGMLDPDILTVMMRNAGASATLISRVMPAVVEQAQSLYVRRCPSLARKVCPGVRPLLGRLQRLGIPMGLVTGNLTRIGWKKLAQAGLKEYFRFGAFGEMAKDRSTLAEMAIRQARRKGWIDGKARISLIGDSHNDILAAQANGIRAIAVATGISTREELAALHPDLLVEDLRLLKPSVLC